MGKVFVRRGLCVWEAVFTEDPVSLARNNNKIQLKVYLWIKATQLPKNDKSIEFIDCNSFM